METQPDLMNSIEVFNSEVIFGRINDSREQLDSSYEMLILSFDEDIGWIEIVKSNMLSGIPFLVPIPVSLSNSTKRARIVLSHVSSSTIIYDEMIDLYTEFVHNLGEITVVSIPPASPSSFDFQSIADRVSESLYSSLLPSTPNNQVAVAGSQVRSRIQYAEETSVEFSIAVYSVGLVLLLVLCGAVCLAIGRYVSLGSRSALVVGVSNKTSRTSTKASKCCNCGVFRENRLTIVTALHENTLPAAVSPQDQQISVHSAAANEKTVARRRRVRVVEELTPSDEFLAVLLNNDMFISATAPIIDSSGGGYECIVDE